MGNKADVLVIGAGIVGSACAFTLQQQGYRVTLVDEKSPGSGVTAAGMGHLVALDESEDELNLCLYALNLWQDFVREHPGVGDYSQCGTLWVAENEEQLAEAARRAERLNHHHWRAGLVNSDQLRRLEPSLRSGLAGGVRVSGDAVIYPPAVAHYLTEQLRKAGGSCEFGRAVVSLHQDGVILSDGSTLHAERIVVAAGTSVSRLLPDFRIFPRKGHLAITDRYPGRLQHQVVSMNYGQAAVTADALTVAANVQPRPTGQWLIGSCRQDQQADTALDPRALSAVLRSATELLPCLAEMRIIRAWAGMRPASPDGHPVIGQHPVQTGIWIAAGHEGLGVTTAFATANLLAAQMSGKPTALDMQPYDPSRFITREKLQYA